MRGAPPGGKERRAVRGLLTESARGWQSLPLTEMGLYKALSGVPVLVVGADGAMGQALAARLEDAGATVYRTSRRIKPEGSPELHLDLAAGVEEWQPPSPIGLAYLCAGVTSLAACSADPLGTALVNVTNTLHLARRLSAQGKFVVYVSTNLVFDGEQAFQSDSSPYSPRCEYARQKVEVEKGLLGLGAGVAVLRVTKVLAPDAPLFRGWLRDLRLGRAVQAFTDLVMAPVTTAYVTTALVRIGTSRLAGVFQVTGDRDISYAEAGRYMAERLRVDPGLVHGIRSEEEGIVIEVRPRHTTLDGARAEAELGMRPQDVWQAIRESLDL